MTNDTNGSLIMRQSYLHSAQTAVNYLENPSHNTIHYGHGCLSCLPWQNFQSFQTGSCKIDQTTPNKALK